MVVQPPGWSRWFLLPPFSSRNSESNESQQGPQLTTIKTFNTYSEPQGIDLQHYINCWFAAGQTFKTFSYQHDPVSDQCNAGPVFTSSVSEPKRSKSKGMAATRSIMNQPLKLQISTSARQHQHISSGCQMGNI